MRIIAETYTEFETWAHGFIIIQIPSGLFEMKHVKELISELRTQEDFDKSCWTVVGKVRASKLMDLIPLYAKEAGLGLQTLRDAVYAAYDLEYNRLNGIGECTP